MDREVGQLSVNNPTTNDRLILRIDVFFYVDHLRTPYPRPQQTNMCEASHRLRSRVDTSMFVLMELKQWFLGRPHALV